MEKKMVTFDNLGTGFSIDSEGKKINVSQPEIQDTGWRKVPDEYIPTNFDVSNTSLLLRIKEGVYYARFVTTKDVTSSDWSGTRSYLPDGWRPPMDIQIVLTGTFSQLGRIWIRKSGQIRYTGTALKGSFQPQNVVCIPTTVFPTAMLGSEFDE